MAHDNHAAGDHGEFEHLAHPVSVKFMVGILMALFFLTFITVAVSHIDVGRAGNLFIALFIASIKAVLVALFFMHLRWDKPFNGVILVGSFAFLILFIALALLDTGEYQHEIVPMLDSPAQQQQFDPAQ